jgi:hypothetical protein
MFVVELVVKKRASGGQGERLLPAAGVALFTSHP